MSLLSPPCQAPSDARVFSVASIEQRPGYFIARGADDHPALIIEIAGKPRAPIVLQNLTVMFNAPCDLAFETERRTTEAVVVECLSEAEEL